MVRILSYWAFYPILAAVLLPLYRVKTTGRKRLKGPAISVMNHCLDFEWFFIWNAARFRYVRFTAEQANMTRWDAGWFNRLMGVLGIPADRPMAIAPAVSWALDRGELVHFFPEGILHRRSQAPGDFFVGAAWFACIHDVPLIPVAEVLDARRIHRLLPWWPPQVRIIVGEPMMPADFRLEGERIRRTAERLTAAAETFIRETLVREGRRSL